VCEKSEKSEISPHVRDLTAIRSSASPKASALHESLLVFGLKIILLFLLLSLQAREAPPHVLAPRVLPAEQLALQKPKFFVQTADRITFFAFFATSTQGPGTGR
jgi:hypothetical protein